MTLPRELPAKKTPLSIPAVWNELLLLWETLGVEPKRVAIELKLAHIKLETGLKSCWNFNVGNTKSTANDGKCWQFFGCGEEVPVSKLAGVVALGSALVTERGRYQRNGVEYVSLAIKAPHPWTRFQAFETLRDGVAGQLGYLRRHADVLAALQTGDPEAYNDALVHAGYYTAGKGVYLTALKTNLNDVVAACRDLDWGDVA